MSPRFLSEPEAWRAVAKRMDEAEWIGPFSALGELRHRADPRISGATHQRAWNRCSAFYPGIAPSTEHSQDQRVLAALFLALEAEDDAKAGVR